VRAVQNFVFLMAFLVCLVFVVHGVSYLTLGADVIPAPTTPAERMLQGGTPLGRYRELATGDFAPVLLIHVAAASTALLLAPIQLLLGVRQASKPLHRAVAVPYVVGALVASLTGFLLSIGAWGGPATSLGFATFGLAWLFTTTRGLVHISQRDLDEHREWMGRSLALAFGGATIRIWLLLLLALGVPAEVAYPFSAWWGWIFNLFVAEFIVRSTIGSSAGRAAFAR
jgi:hypothetical protein